MYNPHMQNYTFIAETDVNGTLAFHFRADEKNISGNSGSLYQEVLQTGLIMDYYEDVWVDPVTGTVLDQKYSIQIKVPVGYPQLGGARLRDIVANYTQESQEAAASTAKLQALAQYYQGHEMVVLTLNGAYTEKTVDGQIDAEKDKVASYTLGTKTLPTILIGLAMVSLMAGFYVYYQTGGAVSGGDMDGPSSEAEPSSATVEDLKEMGFKSPESTEDEAADDTSDGESDAED
jgi:hypothetical protein